MTYHFARRSRGSDGRPAKAASRASLLAAVALLATACTSNTRPELQPVSDQTFFVGSNNQLELRAYDPDGDRLSYSYTVPGLDIRSRSSLKDFADRAIFSWQPIASDVGSHQVDFTVSDGSDSDRETTTIVVKPSTGPQNAPRFIRPGEGERLDLNVKDCITVDVLVDDPDSTQVEIRQEQPIPGSQLRKQGGLAALFEWCPTPQQAATSTWTLRLVADDKENPPVRKLFAIIVVPKSGTRQDGGTPRPDTTTPRPDTTTPRRDSGTTTPVAPVSFDFESSNGGFVASGDWEHGAPAFKPGGTDCSSSAKPPSKAHSGSKVWGTKLTTCHRALSNAADPCANKDTKDDSVLKFKVTIPAPLAKPKLVFWQWTDMFLPYDWAEVRVNGTAVDQQCKGSYVAPTAWVKREVDLSAHSGSTIEIAFHFMASGVINYAGWYIDDVSVVAGN